MDGMAPTPTDVERIDLPVEGMTCAACATRIGRGLSKLDGVRRADVNLAANRATVVYAYPAVDGLVGQYLPQAPDFRRAVANVIARNAPLAVTAAKRSITLGMQMSVLDAHRLEAALFAPLVETDDLREGAAAFFEKRPPQFHRR